VPFNNSDVDPGHDTNDDETVGMPLVRDMAGRGLGLGDSVSVAEGASVALPAGIPTRNQQIASWLPDPTQISEVHCAGTGECPKGVRVSSGRVSKSGRDLG
jgi:hypothetical protein